MDYGVCIGAFGRPFHTVYLGHNTPYSKFLLRDSWFWGILTCRITIRIHARSLSRTLMQLKLETFNEDKISVWYMIAALGLLVLPSLILI